MKETADPRPICYCFDHDAAEFEAGASRREDAALPAAFTAKCKRRLDRCEEKNPQGSCCLGNASLVLRAARQKPGTTPLTEISRDERFSKKVIISEKFNVVEIGPGLTYQSNFCFQNTDSFY